MPPQNLFHFLLSINIKTKNKSDYSPLSSQVDV